MESRFVKSPLCRTSVPSISASADLITRAAARSWFRVRRGHPVPSGSPGLRSTPIDYDGVPPITYSYPEVPHVGINQLAGPP